MRQPSYTVTIVVTVELTPIKITVEDVILASLLVSEMCTDQLVILCGTNMCPHVKR